MKRLLGVMLVILTTILLVGCQDQYHKVFFDTNGSLDVIDFIKVEDGQKINEPTQHIERDGFVFEYWSLNETEFLFDEYVVHYDITLVAKWNDLNNPGDNEEEEAEVELTHAFDFSILSNNDKVATTPSDLAVMNNADISKPVEFTRLNSIIGENTHMPLKGVVLVTNDKTNFNDAYLKTKTPINKLVKVELDFGVWGRANEQNLQLVKGIYIQTSTDGINWVNQKNIKDSVLNEDDYNSTISVEGDFGNSYVRIFAEASGVTTNHQMRFIISNIKFYTKGEIFTGQTFTVSFDHGYENAPDVTTKKVKEGSKVVKPNTPVRTGYTFKGWYEVGNNDKVYDFDSKVTGHLRLVAKWEQGDTGDNPGDNDENVLEYYSDLEGLDPVSLDLELRKMIKERGRATGSTSQVKKVDNYNGQNYNIYDGFGGYGNREHVWPRSKLGNAPDDDLHNLRAAKVNTNSTRSNHPFGDGKGTWKLTSNKFYPGDEHVGDVARIVLYIHVRYNISLSQVGNLEMFLKWHEMDPVNDFERSRNNKIQNIQSNRNPFIDFPEYVSLMFSSCLNLEVSNFKEVYGLDEIVPIYLSFDVILTNDKRDYIV